MTTNKLKTSFIQYLECQICRTHHNTGVKHLYSAHHQANLKKVLKKCVTKVFDAKRYMKTPDIHCSNWESDKNVWCYFCIKEYSKHCTYNSVMVAGLGLIHHLASSEHYELVKKFLKENRLKKSKPEKYIIKKSDLISFLETLPAAVEKFCKKLNKIHEKHMSNIQEVEKQRTNLISEVAHETALPKASCSGVNHINSQDTLPINNKNSLSVRMDTCEQRMQQKIPPWLLPAHITSYSMLSSSGDIKEDVNKIKTSVGPSMDDYLNHLKQEEKKKLNPNRVGANFKREIETSASWIPAFRRIWSKNSNKRQRFRSKVRRPKI